MVYVLDGRRRSEFEADLSESKAFFKIA